jgi:hypothetical protein
MHEKKSEFMGQFRITVEEKSKIRKMLRFYQRDRGMMAREVMEALFYHCDRKDQLVSPSALSWWPKSKRIENRKKTSTPLGPAVYLNRCPVKPNIQIVSGSKPAEPQRPARP